MLVALIALTSAARGEFLRIDQSANLQECATCGRALSAALGKMRGVESVDLDTAAQVVKVVLRPDNRVRLEAVRDAIKAVGYAPGEARVRVRGTAADGEFRVEGLDQAYRLAGEKRPPAREMVVVEGTVPAAADPRAQPLLDVSAVNP